MSHRPHWMDQRPWHEIPDWEWAEMPRYEKQMPRTEEPTPAEPDGWWAAIVFLALATAAIIAFLCTE